MEPQWIAIARSLIGTRETPGASNNAKIMSWANKLGAKVLGITYPGDATPWCGLFVAHCVNSAGLKPAAIAIRAKSWATWGFAVRPCLGAVLVFGREGGGHVGFYVGEDASHYFVLGGNQGDAVSIMKLAKDRLLASRWPNGVAVVTKTVQMSGGVVSRNEA